MPPKSRGEGTGNTYANMQSVLNSTEAANEQMTQTMASVQNAMDMIADTMGVLQPPVIGGGGQGRGGYRGPGAHPSSGNQTTRPPIMPSAFDPHQGQGIGGIRQRIAGALDQRIGLGSGSRFREGVGGTVHETPADGSPPIIHPPDWATSDEGRAALAGQASRGTASGALNRFAAGGLMHAVHAIPYVGTALTGLEAAHEAVTFLSNQREANAHYQAIYGGSNISQLGQRRAQMGFELSNLFSGSMTTAQSREAFQGVSAMGYQGEQRSSDLSFITQNYARMGVSVSDSLKLVHVAAKNLNEGLVGLQSGLESARKAARDTGQSAQEGVQNLLDAQAKIAPIYPGGGGTRFAAALATAQTKSGRYLSSLDYTSMVTDSNVARQIATNMGMNLDQFTGVMGTDPARALAGMEAFRKRRIAPIMHNERIQTAITNTINGIKDPKARAAAQAGHFTPDMLARLAKAMEASGAQYSDQAIGLYQSMGVRNKDGTPMSREEAAQALVADTFGTPPKIASVATRFGKAAGHKNSGGGLLGRLGDDINSVGISISGSGVGLTHIDFGSKDTRSSGVNKVLDDFKTHLANTDYHIIVKTKTGDRVVSAAEALRDYPDQIALGTATIAELNETVGDHLGEKQDSFAYKKDWQKKYGKGLKYKGAIDGPTASKDTGTNDDLKLAALKKIGIDPDKMNAKDRAEFYKKTGISQSVDTYNSSGSGGGSGGTVTIVPGPDLQGVLKFIPSGNVKVAQDSAAASTPPKPSTPPGTQ